MAGFPALPPLSHFTLTKALQAGIVCETMKPQRAQRNTQCSLRSYDLESGTQENRIIVFILLSSSVLNETFLRFLYALAHEMDQSTKSKAGKTKIII